MAENCREDKYLFGEVEDKAFIKFYGNSTMKNSKTLEELFINLFSKSDIDIILDLEECNYMDSTMLGLIAKTAIRVRKSWKKPLYAVKVPNIIMTSFKSTGVNKLIEIIDDNVVNGLDLSRVETKDFDDKQEKTVHILEAHKTLMELNDDNKKVFKNVVSLLEKELDK